MKMKITEYNLKANITRDIRAAFVADTHDIVYDKLVSEIKKQNVDIILMTGDIIYGHDDHVVNGFEMLSAFASIAPTFMCLGNHEGGAPDLVRRECQKRGIHLLEEKYVDYEGIHIGGLTSGYIKNNVGLEENHFKKTPTPNVEWLESFASVEGYKILLSHHPEYYDEFIYPLDIDLTLSGHAHGGQWRIFGRGLFAPGQGIFPKYTSGIHDNRFIVSRGLANNAFVPRLFNPCELIIINLIKT